MRALFHAGQTTEREIYSPSPLGPIVGTGGPGKGGLGRGVWVKSLLCPHSKKEENQGGWRECGARGIERSTLRASIISPGWIEQSSWESNRLHRATS